MNKVVSSDSKTERKRDWILTQSAFRRLLYWLDEGMDSNGQGYLLMWQRLVIFFDRKNCLSPKELADETLNRVARRLEEEGNIKIDTPAHYCSIVAGFVLHEYQRRSPQMILSESLTTTQDSAEEKEAQELRSKCLEKCMVNIPAEDRELIRGYYIGEQRSKIDNRKIMAKKLEITVNALGLRASRIRKKLRLCMRKCLDDKK
jgi:DNA-directed RNA polymerase specialized sigma24 family protein